MTGREKIIPQTGEIDPIRSVEHKIDRVLALLQGPLDEPEKGLVNQVRDLQNGRADHESRIIDVEATVVKFDALREQRNVEMIEVKTRLGRLEEVRTGNLGFARALGLTAAGGIVSQVIAALVQMGTRTPPHH